MSKPIGCAQVWEEVHITQQRGFEETESSSHPVTQGSSIKVYDGPGCLQKHSHHLFCRGDGADCA